MLAVAVLILVSATQVGGGEEGGGDGEGDGLGGESEL